MYGMMGGMEKTTVYLTADQKRALEEAAQAQGRSEAQLIREGIETVTARPRVDEVSIPLANREQTGRADNDAQAARRPRWLSRDEFVRRLVPHPADASLRRDLRELAPDTTDDVAIR
jgi:hypothetical protein